MTNENEAHIKYAKSADTFKVIFHLNHSNISLKVFEMDENINFFKPEMEDFYKKYI